LCTPVGFLHELSRVTPAGTHLHEELEKNLGVQQPFDLQPGGGADLLQRASLLPDKDGLLAIALAVDYGRDAR
jgi:hypothetical protein